MRRLLFIGTGAKLHWTTSRHRADAFRRLDWEVVVLDPTEMFRSTGLWRALHYRTGYRLAALSVARWVRKLTVGQHFDLAWVDGGESTSRSLVQHLQRRGIPVIHFSVDDPTGQRDGRRWDTFRGALSGYDMLGVVRDDNLPEYRAMGAKHVIRSQRGYDPVAHAPRPYHKIDRLKWESRVVFVGTWMPGRDRFILELVQRGVDVSIWGNRWQKAPEWVQLRRIWRGPGPMAEDYVKAIQYADVALGLVSRENRDEITQRSYEIPYIGTAFCAFRTPEHLSTYAEGKEALFWSDPEECAQQCLKLMNDPDLRQSLVAAARRRVIALRCSNDEILADFLKRAHEYGVLRSVDHDA